MTSSRLSIAALLFLPLALVGCDGDDGETDDTEEVVDDTGTDDTGEEVADQGQIRVIHMSPDAPAVDIFVDGIDDPVVTGLEFPDNSPYLDLDVGTYNFRVAVSGSPASEAVLSFEGVEITKGAKITAGAFDNVAALQGFALVDDAEGLASTDIRVTVMHAAPAVGEVDIWEISGEPTPLLEDVPFGASATLPDLASQAYVIGVDVNDDAAPDLTWDIPALPGGTQVNLYAANQGEAVFLVAQLPEGATLRLDPNEGK